MKSDRVKKENNRFFFEKKEKERKDKETYKERLEKKSNWREMKKKIEEFYEIWNLKRSEKATQQWRK